MPRKSSIPIIVSVLMIATSFTAESAEPLALDEAVSLSLLMDDPSVARHDARARALEERAVADSQLPDPKLRVGLANVPLNSFDFSQEAMTQAQIGLSQSFPRGATRSLTRSQREAEAAAARASQDLRRLEIVRETRLAWLERAYWQRADRLVRQSRRAVSDLLEVAQSVFASGRQTAQDVLRAELELSLIDDRLLEIAQSAGVARADLARYIGPQMAIRPVAPDTAQLPPLLAQTELRDRLVDHPAIAITDAQIRARADGVEIAEEQYKPGWSIDAGYGFRSGGRADFASIGVSLDLPFFTGKRQDPNTRAARQEWHAARFDRDAAVLELGRRLDRAHADWRTLADRIALYEDAVTMRARWTRDAALAAYRSGVSGFDELVRTELTEIDTALTLERLRVERLKAQAHLLFLQGDML